MFRKSFIGNLTGAFADGAVLFPLLAALVMQTGMDGATLLATSGAAYIAAGYIFRVPMPVQPLKSVVIAALAMGASAAEVSWSGSAVGIACLALSFCRADKFAALVPKHLVHGLQMALGIMLITKGFQLGMAGLFPHPVPAKPAITEHALRLQTIISLVLPQMALTLTNSVIGTSDAAHKYFGDRAKRVTPERLLRVIGLGNILAAPLGGLPFCHGAGGLTAHVKAGAKTWHMNLIIGGTLLALALVSFFLPSPVIPVYPKLLMSALLLWTGWFHMHLVLPSWKKSELRWILAVMGLAALATQDMLIVLTAGIICEIWHKMKRQKYA